MSETAGNNLKKARLEKGLSLEDVQKATKIHPNILRAIEGDSISDLNPIYLKGFIKIYCQFLGVDPKDYVSDYQQPVWRVNLDKETAREQNAPVPNKPLINLKSFIPGKKFISGFIILIIVILIFAGLFNLGKAIFSHRRALPSKRTGAALAVKVKTEAPRIKPKAQSLPLAVRGEVSTGIRLTVSAKDNCLLFVKSDGHAVFHRVLEKGRSETWLARDRIELDVGNAGAVELQVNEQRFPTIGRRGQTIKGITISLKDGLKIP